MPEDVSNVTETREGGSGGRSSEAGHVASRQRNPKRSLRAQGSVSPTTPLPKRFSAHPKGAPVKAPPPEEKWSAEAELEVARTRSELRKSWRDSSAALEHCSDDFEKPNEKEGSEATSEAVKEVTRALEDAQLEDLQEETTEAVLETRSSEEGAPLRQHHNREEDC